MFLIEGLSSESAKKVEIPDSTPFNFELADDRKHSLMDEIFDVTREDSIVRNV